jgi:hypothetical protein
MFEVYMLQPVTAACELFATSRNRQRLGAEPALDDLMRDPITQALMVADRVDRCELNALLTRVRQTLR